MVIAYNNNNGGLAPDYVDPPREDVDPPHHLEDVDPYHPNNNDEEHQDVQAVKVTLPEQQEGQNAAFTVQGMLALINYFGGLEVIFAVEQISAYEGAPTLRWVHFINPTPEVQNRIIAFTQVCEDHDNACLPNEVWVGH